MTEGIIIISVMAAVAIWMGYEAFVKGAPKKDFKNHI